MNFIFQHPWWLAWSLLAAVPLILYWLRRRNAERVNWAAMQFLQDASRQSANHQLRSWLLLALRVALPIMIALLAAWPRWKSPESSVGQGVFAATHWVLVVDVSASMGPRLNQASGLEIAKAKLNEIVEQAEQGDLFSLIESNELRIDRTTDRSRMKLSIQGLETDGRSFSVDEIAGILKRLWQDVDPGIKVKGEVIIASDFSKSDWRPDLDSGTQIVNKWLASVQNSNGDSAGEVSFRFIDCKPQTRDNLALVELNASLAAITPRQTSIINAVVRNDSDSPVSNVVVSFLSDDQPIGTRTISIDSNSQASVQMPVQYAEAGAVSITATLDSNGLEIDDRRYLAIKVEPEIDLLVLEQNEDAAKQFVAALETTVSSNKPRIVAQVVKLDAIEPLDSFSFDVVAAIDVAKFSVTQTNWMRRFVQGGGQLLVSPSPEFDQESWGRWCNAMQGDLTSFSISKTMASSEIGRSSFTFDPLDYAHPSIARFAQHRDAGLTTVPIERYIQFQTNDSVQRVLDFEKGDPALFVTNLGSGRIAIMTTPLSSIDELDSWNQLPVWWSYVPLVNEFVYWFYGSEPSQNVAVMGEPVSITPDRRWMFDRVNVIWPELQTRAQTGAQTETVSLRRGEPSQALIVTTTSQAKQPGFIRIESPKVAGESEMLQLLAVNVPPDEFDSASVAFDWLVEQFESPNQRQTDGQNMAESNLVSAGHGSIGYWLAGVLLLVLLLEPVVAGWNGLTRRNGLTRLRTR